MKFTKEALISITLFATLATPALAIDTARSNHVTRLAQVETRIASREAELKAKLDAFKDKNKAQRAERVNTTLVTINKNRTDHYTKFLNNASRILDKLEAREASKSGTSSATAAIADARTAIVTAKAAVATQSAKDYTITVSSETTVKSDAQKSMNSLRNDLKLTLDVVMTAKKAVAHAIQVAATSKGDK
jgi:hypothetical protein